MITIGSDAEPIWLLQSSYNERNAELSPDGKWMAYQSDESGRPEIYVSPFPNVEDNRWPVSNTGGRWPLWSRDGRELFYIEAGDPGQLISVSVEATETEFLFGTRTPILDWPYLRLDPRSRFHDVSEDGRFLAVKQGGVQSERPEIVVVQNWFEELKRLAPTSP